MSWAELLEAYLAFLADQGRRPHTVRGYRGDLRALVRHVGEGPVDTAVLRGWVSSLDGLAPATRARRVSAARGFLGWAAQHGGAVCDLDALKLRTSRTVAAPRGLRSEAWLAVEASLDSIPLHADLDQLLFKLLAHAGLRPGEALDLQIEDFDPSTGRLHVVGWGGAERQVWIDDPELRLRLVHWIRATGRTSGPLFCAAGRSTPLRYQSMLERWQRYADASGARLRLGDLRIGHAARLLAGGVPEWVVRERLGQPTGRLPMPSQALADEEIQAWRLRVCSPQTGRRPRGRDETRRVGG